MADFYKVIVREPDGLERVVAARFDQVITDSIVLWDERTADGAPPPPELLAKAEAEDQKRKDAVTSKKTLREAALTRLLASNDKDIEDLCIVLGLK